MKFNRIYVLIIIIITIIIITVSYISVIYQNNKQSFNNLQQQPDNITVVSGYWKVKNKHGHANYNDWFKNTLKINQRYIFFCDESDNDYINSFRNNYETIFINRPINEFYSKKYAKDCWINDVHSPSVELSMIWHEKTHLMKMAKDYDTQNGTPTEFYVWIDSGIAHYRNKEPPQKRLNLKDINSLPHDKICICDFFYPDLLNRYNIIGPRNAVTGGCFIMHRDLIDKVHELYYQSLDECNQLHENDSYCSQEQLIYTDIKDQYPDLFHRMSNGWGTNLEVLFNDYV